MELERKLSDTGILREQGWRSIAESAIDKDLLISDVVAVEAMLIVDRVIRGNLTVGDLRQGVSWANAHDRESFELLGGLDQETIHAEDRIEATARRIAHHAGRSALKGVGSRRARTTHIVRMRQPSEIEPRFLLN